jgi:prevent-host-death family protein
MTTATIFETKTNLSQLIKKARSGEEVIITSGRDKIPVAKLTPMEPRRIKRLGVCANPKFVLPADFFEPPTNEELNQWESDLA